MQHEGLQESVEPWLAAAPDGAAAVSGEGCGGAGEGGRAAAAGALLASGALGGGAWRTAAASASVSTHMLQPAQYILRSLLRSSGCLHLANNWRGANRGINGWGSDNEKKIHRESTETLI